MEKDIANVKRIKQLNELSKKLKDISEPSELSVKDLNLIEGVVKAHKAYLEREFNYKVFNLSEYISDLEDIGIKYFFIELDNQVNILESQLDLDSFLSDKENLEVGCATDSIVIDRKKKSAKLIVTSAS